MKQAVAAGVLLFALCTVVSSTVLVRHMDQSEDEVASLDQQWEDFKTAHGKQYDTADEESIRKQIFTENVRQIELHNYQESKGLKTFRMGINRFTDMDALEVAKQMNGFRLSKAGQRVNGSAYLSSNVPVAVPSSVDWRPMGYVTPVKDQGQCGSCWAFSATGSLEGQTYRKTGRLVSLSEENLVDCSTKQGNMGCAGGLMDLAFTYVKENGGIDTEESYPYMARQGKCVYNAANIGATCTGYVDIPTGDEKKLMEAVSTVGPVSVAIDASLMSFSAYKSGIYIDAQCSSTMLDHGVLVVGYGTQDGQDYWIVKNSWGASWGNNGYILMARNRNNQCGIATMASYPLV